MKLFKKFAFAAVAATSLIGLASCGGATEEKVNITVGVTQDTGNNFQSMKTFLDALSEPLNFTWDYQLMDSRNDANNLTALQNSLNSGTRGIINMTDMTANNLQTLLKSLELNDAYYAGYQTDMTNAAKAGLLDNERIVGTVTDGESGELRGEVLFNQIVKTNLRKVVFAQFPAAYFPAVVGAVDKFKELATAYNASHDDKFTYYTGSGDTYPDANTYQFQFSVAKLPDAEYDAWKSAGVEAVIAVNSLAKRLLTGDKSIKIYSVGWDDEVISDFGADKTIRTLAQTPAETILYPLIKVLNAIRGNNYSDEPTKGSDTVVTGHYIFVTSTEDIAAGKTNSMNFSEDHAMSRSLITVADAAKLLASNGGTFAKLKATIDSWDSDYVLYRK